MVLLEPPAPAARVELGLVAVLPARRLGETEDISQDKSRAMSWTCTHRTCAPAGRDTALDELERTATGAASESDCILTSLALCINLEFRYATHHDGMGKES